MTSEALPATPSHPAHSYATRIRQSVPTVRLRYDPDTLRAIKPAPIPRVDNELAPSDLAPFPSPNVVLHPDDANSKVFHAVARSLLAVDNRAMTVKDLAEMCIHKGLQCQNLNAASQAITTYTRDHLKRCEQEQDQPLLLRHILSGTPSDDKLFPALYSTSGGGCQRDSRSETAPNRTTNFRKGTVIWYLSRVTGAPCPFARAGIRLCDHVDPSLTLPKASSKRGNHVSADQCGDKRKRRSTRECVIRATRRSGSRSPGPSDDERSDAEAPPAKVKLIVRLKPLAKCFTASTPAPTQPPPSLPQVIDLSLDSDDESDAMSVDESDEDSASLVGECSVPQDSIPQMYPRRSISIPPYSPSNQFSSYGTYESSHVPESEPFTRYRRSASVPYSTASPPPDSDEEDDEDDQDSPSGGSQSTSTSYAHSPFDVEDDDDYASSDFYSEFGDNDADTSFESPGPRSPFSAAPISLPSIKQEPRDVQGILDAWDDMEGSSGFVINAPTTEEEAKIVEVIGKAATCVLEAGHIKEEDGADWDVQRYRLSSSPLDVKQEDDSDLTLDLHSPSFTSWRTSDMPVSPLSASSPGFDFEDYRSFDEYSSSPLPRRGSETTWNREDHREYDTLRPRANTVASLGGLFGADEYGPDRNNTLTRSLTSLIESLSVNTHSIPPIPSCQDEVSRESSSPPPVCISPNDMRLDGSSVFGSNVVAVVDTCQPTTPPISATQVDGLFVYQASLGDQIVLRRIDNDYVNLTAILTHSRSPPPVLSTIPSAVVVKEGPLLLHGTWVPLQVAQTYVNDHPIPTASSTPSKTGVLDLFLNERLSDRFPASLRNLVHSNWRQSIPGQFGRRFDALQARDLAEETVASTPISVEDELPSTTSVLLRYNEPLTAKEQEIFQSICVNLEWENDEPPRMPQPVPTETEPEPSSSASHESDSRPLRRSKRVANLAAKTRTRR
ncbi:hypothetical protein CPB85DRAFT_1428494 [Mucidula mucida]|nr:hypothetical protein CPB85DRAFT_1428494 [Mucidula mucida]